MNAQDFELPASGYPALKQAIGGAINHLPHYQGGKIVIERLIETLGLRNRQDLADLTGITTGAMATWQTRNTTPWEFLVRIHLFTGIPVPYLFFGIKDEAGFNLAKNPAVTNDLNNKVKVSQEKLNILQNLDLENATTEEMKAAISKLRNDIAS